MLVLVGFLVGIGVIVLNNTMIFSSDVVALNESLAVTNATATAFTTNYIKSITFVGNATNDCTNASTFTAYNQETLYITVTDTVACNDPGDCCGTLAGTWNIEGTYYNTASDVAGDITAARDAVGDIATNWFALIITIIVLAIILFLVMRSFGRR